MTSKYGDVISSPCSQESSRVITDSHEPHVSNKSLESVPDYTVIQIKYGLPYCVTCPSMSMDPGSLNPGTRRSRVPEYPGGGIPGSLRILGQVTQFWQNILNLYYSTGSWKLFWYLLSGILFPIKSSHTVASHMFTINHWGLYQTTLLHNPIKIHLKMASAKLHSFCWDLNNIN